LGCGRAHFRKAYENRARREPPTWVEALLFTAIITMRSQPALEAALAAEVPVVHLPGPATACTAVSGWPLRDGRGVLC
jgi:hypothetical protein